MPTAAKSPLDAIFLSKSETYQIDVNRRVAFTVGQINATFNERWSKLLSLLKNANSLSRESLKSEVRQALLAIANTSKHLIRQQLTATAEWGYRRSAEDMLDVMPEEWKPALGVRLFEAEKPKRKPFSGVQIGAPRRANLSREELKAAWEKFVLEPPSKDELNEIIDRPINGKRWEERLDDLSHKVTNPKALADVVTSELSQGTNWRTVARRIQPYVSNVASSAKRIARTETRRVANQIQDKSWEPMQDVIAGYQIRATLDQTTRSTHAHRNGRIYWKDSSKGEYSANERPDLPDEPNCRCWYTPVLTPPDWAIEDPELLKEFQPEERDVLNHQDWFARAGEKERKEAVGATRYNTVKDKLGFEASSIHWHNFIDPKTGELIPIDKLKKMNREELIALSGENLIGVTSRRQQLKTVARFGFLPEDKSIGAAQNKTAKDLKQQLADLKAANKAKSEELIKKEAEIEQLKAKLAATQAQNKDVKELKKKIKAENTKLNKLNRQLDKEEENNPGLKSPLQTEEEFLGVDRGKIYTVDPHKVTTTIGERFVHKPKVGGFDYGQIKYEYEYVKNPRFGDIRPGEVVKGTNLSSNYTEVWKEKHGVAKTLSDDEKKAIQYYSHRGDKILNKKLREAPQTTLSEDSKASAIQSAILDKGKPIDEPVWRGLKFKNKDNEQQFMAQFKSAMDTGESVTFHGFTSTSLDFDIASQFRSSTSSGVIFQIKANKGLYIEELTKHKVENEVLLPHGSQFRVVGMKKIKVDKVVGKLSDRTVIELEQL